LDFCGKKCQYGAYLKKWGPWFGICKWSIQNQFKKNYVTHPF
jgi:hypothetical protein